MPGSENQPLERDVRCFEYALGTLRGEARAEFARELAHSETLQADVRFWEEQLMSLLNLKESRNPAADSWAAIEHRINTQRENPSVAAAPRRPFWSWAFSGVLATALVMVLMIGGPLPDTQPLTPNADYVAVLTDGEGRALLTALTLGRGQTLWLKWEDIVIDPDNSVQLWAVSRRDGQVRPLAVFDEPDVVSLPLSDALWRLIQDADYLLLTEEEAGGSPLDEPSSQLLARGVCVRFVDAGSG